MGRLCPPVHAILDELPSTATLPTLRTQMANESALGTSFMWAAQAWPQLSAILGDAEARALLGLTNNLIVFGGVKDAPSTERSPTCSAKSESPGPPGRPGRWPDAFLGFAETWEYKYPAMVDLWERSWTEFIPFLDLPAEIRKLICAEVL